MENSFTIKAGKLVVTINGKAQTLRSNGESKNYRVFANAKGMKPMFTVYARKGVKTAPAVSLKANGKTDFSNRFVGGKYGDKVFGTVWTPFTAVKTDKPVGKTVRKSAKTATLKALLAQAKLLNEQIAKLSK